MEVLVLDGKSFVKASKAAKDLGYATDYVGQLCRSGQVDAHLIGRTWYVNQEMLSTHRVEKKRTSRVKAREYARKTIEEHRLKVVSEKNNYRNIDIQYEQDQQDLIPETRKLTVSSSPVVDKKRIKNADEYEGSNEILNRGERVIMSGDVTVVDVTDGHADSDTVILTPGRIRRSPKSKVVEGDTEDVEVSSEIAKSTNDSYLGLEIESFDDTERPSKAIDTRDTSVRVAPDREKIPPENKMSFIERLERNQTVPPVEDIIPKDDMSQIPYRTMRTTQRKAFMWPYMLCIGLTLLVSLLSVCLLSVLTYDKQAQKKIDQEIFFSLSKTIKQAQSR